MPLVATVTTQPAVLAAVQRAAAQGDFTTVDAPSGLELLRIAFVARPDAVVIDIDLPDIDPFELLRILRAAAETLPILVVTRGVDPAVTARALDVGADDVARYDTPTLELVARLRAALRRTERSPGTQAASALAGTGALAIDRVAREVRKHGEPVPLTRTEYRLLDALAARIGQVAPHRYLLDAVWGEGCADDTHYLRVYIGYLRAKLEDDPRRPRYLVNEWGVGYRLAQLPLVDPPGSPGG